MTLIYLKVGLTEEEFRILDESLPVKIEEVEVLDGLSDLEDDYVSDIEDEALEEPEIDEFTMLAKYFNANKAVKRVCSQGTIWIEIMKEIKYTSPHLYDVINLLLIIPNGTSELERIFSAVKEMKSKKRTKMKAWKLADMILIYYFLDLETYNKDSVYAIFQTLMAQ